jgi:hypothetical protein
MAVLCLSAMCRGWARTSVRSPFEPTQPAIVQDPRCQEQSYHLKWIRRLTKAISVTDMYVEDLRRLFMAISSTHCCPHLPLLFISLSLSLSMQI